MLDTASGRATTASETRAASIWARFGLFRVLMKIVSPAGSRYAKRGNNQLFWPSPLFHHLDQSISYCRVACTGWVEYPRYRVQRTRQDWESHTEDLARNR